MLNQSNVRTSSYTTRKTILVDEQNSTALSCIVSDAGVSADESGAKVVKAGTPVAGSLTARETAFTVTTNGTGAVGVILHDVDVTNGPANSQVVIFGFIDVSKLDTEVVAMTEAAADTLKMIQFVK